MNRRADQDLCPLVISAPFGNYIRPPGATPTLGTFTALPRPGRLWRILRTVRYYPRLGAWVNKIGLRNPGIDWLATQAQRGRADVRQSIISIHGFSDDDWRVLITKAAALRPLAIELNMSCPNVGHVNWPAFLFPEAHEVERASSGATAVIVKLPPVNYRGLFDQALAAGLRWFHCCNTLPVPAGGVSGKPLKPVATACILDCVERAGAARGELRVIGGGGITTPEDVDDYAAAGATRFAVGTKVFNPKYLWSSAGLSAILDRARARSGTGGSSDQPAHRA